jgi:predicted PurR-regulated permease PerM
MAAEYEGHFGQARVVARVRVFLGRLGIVLLVGTVLGACISYVSPPLAFLSFLAVFVGVFAPYFGQPLRAIASLLRSLAHRMRP